VEISIDGVARRACPHLCLAERGRANQSKRKEGIAPGEKKAERPSLIKKRGGRQAFTGEFATKGLSLFFCGKKCSDG